MAGHAFIQPPNKIPLPIRLGIFISKKVTKRDLLPPKLLAWYPKAAIGSGVLESLVAHGKKDLDPRILKLVRIQVSMAAACPFCVDMNSFAHEKEGITREEMQALAEFRTPDELGPFSIKERLALEYARRITETPVIMPPELVEKLFSVFTEREIVILASTAAQVNYWARMLVALGVPPEGFSDSCEIPPR